MADPEGSEYSGSEESDEEESSSDEEEQQHERPLKEARKDAVYNTVGLHEKLEEIGWPGDVEWMHSLAITYPVTGDPVDVDDDLSREMSFYTQDEEERRFGKGWKNRRPGMGTDTKRYAFLLPFQALDGAREAFQKFQSLGIPFQRPTDYYAEMVKTDTHMLKIKDKLLHEKTQLEEMDERRKSRDSKKFAKEVQAEKLKERSKRKKEDIESVKKWRKVRQKSGFTEGGDVAPPIEFDTGKRNQFGKSTGQGRGRDRQPSKNRQFRDSRYGNGGRKSDKRNNAESSADDSTFRANFKGKDRGSSSRGRGRGGASFRGRSGSRGRGSSRGSSRGRGRGRG